MADPALGERVRRFYEDLPFNCHGSPEAAQRAVRDDPVRAFPDLRDWLRRRRDTRVLEYGCGAGLFACALARHYRTEVTAVDFCGAALERAGELAHALRLRNVRFVQADLFEHAPAAPADLVLSLGALHHTGDPAGALRRIAGHAGAGGCLYAGLYHAPGRQPFLEAFRRLLAHAGEDAALARYRELDGVRAGDEQHLRSWFRDQVLHPHETQHTLQEVLGWLEGSGLVLRSTSINRFAPLPALAQLFALEAGYESVSRRALEVENRYFPGFFTLMAERC